MSVDPLDRQVRYRGNSVVHEVNRIHPYPGMMAPSIIEAVLDRYGTNVRSVLDPFCGTGRVLVAARQRGCNGVGVDMNPLAIMIAGARLRLPHWQSLCESCDDVLKAAARCRGVRVRTRIVKSAFPFDFWFSPRVIEDLARLLSAIELRTVFGSNIRRMLLVAFSETVRACSYTRENEHKLYRVPSDARRRLRRNAGVVFRKIVVKYAALIRKFGERRSALWNDGSAQVLRGDIRRLCPGRLAGRTFDAVVTSPPYGDAKTTVAYGQFSRLSLLWMQAMANPPLRLVDSDIMSLDRAALGGSIRGIGWAPHGIAKRILDRIHRRDALRAKQVAAYFSDLKESLMLVSRRLRRQGLLVLVLGRRVVGGFRIPLDQIVGEWLSELSINVEDILARDIPRKRIPRCVARRGIAGADRSLTILQEHVLIAKKR